MNNKVHIEIIVYNWSWSVYTVICHRFVTPKNHCKRLFVKLTIKFLKKKNCVYFSFAIIIFLLKKLCKCQLLGDTTLNNFIDVCMKVRARWFWKASFKNLLQIMLQLSLKLKDQLFVIQLTSNILLMTNNYINGCTGLYRRGSL